MPSRQGFADLDSPATSLIACWTVGNMSQTGPVTTDMVAKKQADIISGDFRVDIDETTPSSD